MLQELYRRYAILNEAIHQLEQYNGARRGRPRKTAKSIFRKGSAGSADASLSLEEDERALILDALGTTGGNQTKAASLLHISRDTLRYKIKKFKLE